MNKKKDKLQKNLLTASLGLATVVAVGVATDTQAKASEKEATTPSTTVKAENPTVDLKKQVENQEKVVETTETEVKELKNNVISSTKEVANLEEKAKEATPEKISKVEKIVEDKKADLKVNEEKAKTLTISETDKQKEVALAETEVKVAEINLEKAKEETTKAETDLQKAKEVLAGTNQEKVVKTLEEAKKQVELDKADLEAKAKALEEAKKQDKVRQDRINTLTTTKEQTTKDFNKVSSDLEAKTKELEIAKTKLALATKELEVAKNNAEGINRIVLSEEYVKALKDSQDYDTLSREERRKALETLKRINDEVDNLNKYHKNKNDDMKTKYDIENLPENVRTELSLFAADLINQIRDQFKLPRVKVTPSAVEFAKIVGNGYTTDNWNAQVGHDARAVNEGAREFGLPTSSAEEEAKHQQYYENYYGYGLATKNVTLAELKREVYNGIIGFMFNGQEWLHAQSIAGINWGQPDEEYFGLDFSISNGWTNIHYIKVPKHYLENATKSNFNTTEIVNPNDSTTLLSKLTTAEKSVSNINAEVDTKSKEQVAVQTSYNNTKKSLADVTSELEFLENTKTFTGEATDSYVKASDRLANDTNVLNKAQKDFDSLNADIKTKQRAVEIATTLLAEKEKTQVTKQREFNEKQAVLDTLVKQLRDIQKQISENNKVISELKQDIKTKEVELAVLQNAPKLLKVEQEKLAELKSSLSNKEKQLAEAIDLYSKLLKQQIGNLEFDQKAPENVLPEAVITEFISGSIVKYNVREEFDSTLEKGKRVVKVKGKDGKRVVKLDVLTVNNQEVSRLEKEVLSEEKAVDEIVLVGTKEESKPTEPTTPAKQTNSEDKNTKKENVQKLPNTGETTSDVAGFGLLLSVLTLGLYRRKQR
jgi:LPXTG cell wall surface protein